MSRTRRLFTVLCGLITLLAVSLPAAPAVAEPAGSTYECSADHYFDDARFGPRKLPKNGFVGVQLRDYRRTGSLEAEQFLAEYHDQATGWWRYPPADGYVIGPDGQPTVSPATLRPGLFIDRYGSEYGQFLAPFGTPYANRSIPPQSLVSTPAGFCNYRGYLVLKPFTVDSGPIAPWFAQPGHGWQYQLKAAHVPGAPSPLNVKWLLDNGFLLRVVGPPQS
ncbi:uncharacterized protein DUF4237 [Herbihabitans rhizosphaerae]|uniref:Uncharacterized protein DUF4237 n=1 Tax=Herbihabitans rhizosphaerae TaxID=1872711 RepID=A0A4Q7KLL1_9PSEU|nr:TNT domain-containing protein [Herbihabitans rhizosphaerae]RZS37147.1 uncharacterized protein DUF4237 [Herbihabitans rhizosphaerae]